MFINKIRFISLSSTTKALSFSIAEGTVSGSGGSAADGIQRQGVSLLLRVADEQNLTRGQFLRFAYPADFNTPIVDHPATGNFRHKSSKRNLPETATPKY